LQTRAAESRWPRAMHKCECTAPTPCRSYQPRGTLQLPK
jgi:hypothetical protein